MENFSMNIKCLFGGALFLVGMIAASTVCKAHFGLILPSKEIIAQSDDKTITLEAKFIHPLEGHYMELTRPTRFGVLHRGQQMDLLQGLQEAKGRGRDQLEEFTFWKVQYLVKRPGDYIFYLEPSPYWEPAEDSFIVHYTKVCVNAFGLEDGWDQPVGLQTEIIPMTRPYGLWTHNLFTGQVLLNGKPSAFAEIEVEYLNDSIDNPAIVVPPSDPFITQVVKADSNGIFSYAMPRTGWWGFAALNKADWTLKHEGVEKDVEIGAVYWVHTTDMQ